MVQDVVLDVAQDGPTDKSNRYGTVLLLDFYIYVDILFNRKSCGTNIWGK